jgi:hypothetical protein
MLINELVNLNKDADNQRLLALATFLKDRAEDENAQTQISQAAFIDLAQSLGVNVTPENLNQMISQDPLKNILQPIQPGSNVIQFSSNTESQATGMSVDQARAVVDSNAKAAMKRRQ